MEGSFDVLGLFLTLYSYDIGLFLNFIHKYLFLKKKEDKKGERKEVELRLISFNTE